MSLMKPLSRSCVSPEATERSVAKRKDGEPDGRTTRSERTRAAIVAAALKLASRGNWRPTAAEVAKIADTSVRSLFGYFPTLELLRLEVLRHHEIELTSYLPADRIGMVRLLLELDLER